MGFLLGVAVAVPAVAAAPAASPPGAACLAIPDDADRLACFDREIRRAVGPDGSSAMPPGDAVASGSPGPAGEPVVAATDRSSPGAADAAGDDDGAVRAPSLLDAAWGFSADSRPAYLRLHEPNYLLLARYSTDVNDTPYQPLFEEFSPEDGFESVEAKFQLSFRGRLATSDDRRWGLWFAYTQQSNWQLYAGDISRPFRETNYMPELFGSFRPGVELGGFKWNLLNFGYTHQSNGRADPISRSWDRLFVEAGFDRNDFALVARAWMRIEPGEYEDDNPDIVDYLGHGQITALYRWRENSFTLMGRGNLGTGKGAVQFGWTSRPLLGPLRGYVQLFSGYGETMIDYDWNQTTIGIGVSLNSLL